ncbi:YebC/PmpR family DNA-binding transcriptional regulator [Alphaproteobacteria bacterium endosymbiont of Tiliacea citrago]|uniref:YebC/PmpR family DNA-binding transcriptional regulator n=1 Tax=Alphaproteobacteria bacterium endosymbiont of Tiliacea citrago TaxID=3077944 RepID=UPI00313DEBCA
MAGHSHAKNVAGKKNAMDKKRAKVFMKIAKIITVAVKEGSSNNPDFNPRLRLALKMAQNANVPKDIIKKAIETKIDPNEKVETIVYEGYLDGVAIIVLAHTCNKNKTAPEIRYIFSRANGSIAEPNSVVFMFNKISKVECEVPKDKEEDFLLDSASIGALDVSGNIAKFSVDMHNQAQVELEKNWPIIFAGITYEPNTCATKGSLEAVEALIEKLEENESVEACWHNYSDN